MEFRDRGAEVSSSADLLKARLPLILGGLVALAVIGVLVVLLFMFGVLPPGRRTAASTVQPTATLVAAAPATNSSTPAAPAQETPSAESTSAAPAQTNTPVIAATAPAPTAPAPAAPTKVAQGKLPARVAPAANASANPFPGIYVTQMRIDPAYPHKNETIDFYVTFSNTSGQMQTFSVCVEAFRVGDIKSFGITYCPPQAIQPGTSELMTGGWVVTGIRECVPVRARPFVKEGDIRTPFQQTNGSDLWLDFQVCP